MALIEHGGQHARAGGELFGIGDAEQKAIDLVLDRRKTKTRQRAGQRQEHAIAFDAERDAFELVLAQIAVGKHADDAQPDVVDLDQPVQRMAVGKQIVRGLGAEHGDRGKRVVVVLVQRAALRHA